MKRISMKTMVVCILAVSYLLTASCIAFTEGIDLSHYTDDEIVALLEQVQGEIVSRGIEKIATIDAGMYVGGKDIPAGSYVLICKTDSDHHGIVCSLPQMTILKKTTRQNSTNMSASTRKKHSTSMSKRAEY